MDSQVRELPKGRESKAARIAGRVVGCLAAASLIATCIYLLIQRKPDVATYPGMCAAIIGYLIMRPGKRSIRISGGGVVVDVMADDTGVIKTGVDAVVGHITTEISGSTLQSIRQTQPPPIPGSKKNE